MEELSYVTNPAARALVGGRSQVLGIFTFAPVFPVDYRDFYYPFLLGMEEEAEQQGYDRMLFTSRIGSAAYVGGDYAAVTAELVDHLAELGHTRIAYLGWPETAEPTVDRRRGYDEAHARRGGRLNRCLPGRSPTMR